MKNPLPSYIYRRADGVLYFKKRAGKGWTRAILETQFPEGDPIPFALHQERERLLHDPAPVAPGNDMAFVIRKYMAGPKYTKLKPRTGKDYEGRLLFFTEQIGHLEPRHIERRHVIAWQEKWAKKSGHEANYRLRVLRLLMERAIDYGLLPVGGNPCKGVAEVSYEKRDRQPWPETKVAAFRKAYPYGTRERTCFELLIGTGQRIGDVLKMQWNHIEGGGILVTQGKTGKRLWVPMTDHLETSLRVLDRGDSLFILQKDMTKTSRPGPWAYRGASDAMRKARSAVGAEAYDLHALRYTAAVELLLAGCDDETIAAVTGQSIAMVQHYTRHVRQKARAQAAGQLRKLERNKNKT